MTLLTELDYRSKSFMKNPFLLLVLSLMIIACKELETKEFPFNREPFQTFHVDSKKDTLLVGAKGTQFYFQADGLVDSLGKIVDGTIDINLQEFYTIQDFIRNGLVMQTIDNKPLSSSGMINLEVSQNGKTLQVNTKKPYLLKFYQQEKSPNADLFIGQKVEGESMKWEETKSEIIPIVQITERIEQLAYGAEKITRWYDTLGFINSKTGFEFLNLDKTKRARNRLSMTDGLSFFIPEGFGFLNCDVFFQQETIEFFVEVKGSLAEPQIIIEETDAVFAPINCLGEKCLFNLPKDFTISAYVAFEKSGAWFFDLQKGNSSNGNIMLNPRESSLEEIKLAIDSLR